MATANRKTYGAERGKRYVSTTAPAKLVAAWPDGIDWPIVAPPRSGSALGIVSNGRGLFAAALRPSEIRSADHTQAAVNATEKRMLRCVRYASSAASAIQTSPK
jgi:hypothetical protein